MKMPQKKPITFKKRGRPFGSGTGKRIPGTDHVVKNTEHGQDPQIIIHPEEKIDIEESTLPPNDDMSRHQYPPPKKNPAFRKIWGQFIESVCRRENFNVGHLNALEILCDLFAEYEELHAFIRKKGRSYQAIGRSGTIWKLYPEVSQLKSVQHQINVYMKQLGLILKRDLSGMSGGGGDNWD